MKCVICEKKMKGEGNSALPLSEGRCCNACYFEHVVPMKAYKYGVLIPAKGRAKPYEIKNIGTLMELNSLQEAVKGYIQPVDVDYHSGKLFLVDEEGKLRDKPLNEVATKLVQDNLFEGDYIVGDALLVMREEKFKYFTYDTAKVKADLINSMAE